MWHTWQKELVRSIDRDNFDPRVFSQYGKWQHQPIHQLPEIPVGILSGDREEVWRTLLPSIMFSFHLFFLSSCWGRVSSPFDDDGRGAIEEQFNEGRKQVWPSLIMNSLTAFRERGRCLQLYASSSLLPLSPSFYFLSLSHVVHHPIQDKIVVNICPIFQL